MPGDFQALPQRRHIFMKGLAQASLDRREKAAGA